MKIKKTTPLLFSIAAINPMAGVLASLSFLLAGRPINWWAFSFCLALVYSYLPPLWDERNNFYDIYVYEWVNLNGFNSLTRILSSQFGFEYRFIAFLYAAFIILTLTKIIGGKITSQYQSGPFYRLASLLLLLFLLEYRLIFDLQKTTLGLAFFLIGLSSNQILFRGVLFCLSCMIHPFFVLFACLYFVPIPFMRIKGFALDVLIITLCLVFSIAASSEFAISILQQLPLIPDRSVGYLSSEFSRFSSSIVAGIVYLIRVLALAAFFVLVRRYYISETKKANRRVVRLTLVVVMIGLLLSTNEVYLERLFLTSSVLVTYLSVTQVWSRGHVLILCFFAGSNFAPHFVYNTVNIHSDSYEVIGDANFRRQMSSKVLTHPTPLLLQIGKLGYSDDVIYQWTERPGP